MLSMGPGWVGFYDGIRCGFVHDLGMSRYAPPGDCPIGDARLAWTSKADDLDFGGHGDPGLQHLFALLGLRLQLL